MDGPDMENLFEETLRAVSYEQRDDIIRMRNRWRKMKKDSEKRRQKTRKLLEDTDKHIEMMKRKIEATKRKTKILKCIKKKNK